MNDIIIYFDDEMESGYRYQFLFIGIWNGVAAFSRVLAEYSFGCVVEQMLKSKGSEKIVLLPWFRKQVFSLHITAVKIHFSVF
jgi:hypothetical protein